MIWPCACPRLRLDVMALASSRVPPLPFISHPTGQVPRVLGKMTWLRACSGSRLAVTRRRHHSCAATPIRIPSCWPCACVLGVLMLSRACSCSRLAVMAAESLPCCRPRSYPNARVLMLMRVGSGCSILRMPLPLLVSHRAGQMPCVLGGSMWPRACLGSRLAVMAAASLVCRRPHSYPIPLAICAFAGWARGGAAVRREGARSCLRGQASATWASSWLTVSAWLRRAQRCRRGCSRGVARAGSRSIIWRRWPRRVRGSPFPDVLRGRRVPSAIPSRCRRGCAVKRTSPAWMLLRRCFVCATPLGLRRPLVWRRPLVCTLSWRACAPECAWRTAARWPSRPPPSSIVPA